jgi:hypothetical protein
MSVPRQHAAAAGSHSPACCAGWVPCPKKARCIMHDVMRCCWRGRRRHWRRRWYYGAGAAGIGFPHSKVERMGFRCTTIAVQTWQFCGLAPNNAGRPARLAAATSEVHMNANMCMPLDKRGPCLLMCSFLLETGEMRFFLFSVIACTELHVRLHFAAVLCACKRF